MNLEILSEIPPGEPKTNAILFVHGMWHGAWCWKEHFLPYFKEKSYASYAVSLRGHGDSTLAGEINSASITDYIADIHEAIRIIAKPTILVGHSMGGYLVQKYMEKYKTTGGVLLASVPPGGPVMASVNVFVCRMFTFCCCLALRNLKPLVEKKKDTKHWLFSDSVDSVTIDRINRKLCNESLKAYLQMFKDIFKVLISRNKADRPKIPIMVIGATSDRLISECSVNRTAKYYTDMNAQFIPGAHDIMLEPTWKQAADAIVDWLNENKL